ncbi:MAG: tetratricopeptide repeat protein [Verrucomicrobia bacterium]|nr:tetratricopeptide repeat protein [Verrucomicrobiota bacterium]
MPPWPPAAGFGSFAHSRALSEEDLKLILDWIDSGHPEGEGSTGVAVAASASGQPQREPDLVVKLPEPFVVPASGVDVFRNFVIPLGLEKKVYASAMEFRPNVRAAIHHATLVQDITGVGRSLDQQDSTPGFEGIVGGMSAGDHFVGWTPGKLSGGFGDGLAWALQPGADLIVQLHLLPTGKEEMVQPEIAFWLSDEPPFLESATLHLSATDISIPAETPDHLVKSSLKLPVASRVVSIYPHAHFLCREVKVFAILPDLTPAPLIWIKPWNFDWQDEYFFTTPVELPAGSEIRMHFVYDNSGTNDRNPFAPPKTVDWGPRSSDEMADVWIKLVPDDQSQVPVLRKAFEQLEIDNLRKGYEFQLTRDPFNFVANSRLGHMLVGEGQTAQAIPLLSAALEVTPDSWSVLHNLGLAHVTGTTADLSRAQEYFGRALDANPDFAPARREMATVLAMTGQQEDSLAHFSQYLEARPDDAEVRGNFGVVLARTNRSVEAEEQYRRALVDDPFNPTIYANLASLLQRTDRQDQAIAVLRSGIKNIARTTRLRLQLAAMLRNESPPTEARQLVRDVLEIDPENAEARQAAEVLEQSR